MSIDVEQLQQERDEARNLARWAVQFVAAGSPGRLAADEKLAQWTAEGDSSRGRGLARLPLELPVDDVQRVGRRQR
jgi:hypothetical protein